MASGHTFRDNQPMGHLGRMGIYMSLVLAIVHCTGFFMSMPSMAAETGWLVEKFHPTTAFHKGQWWQVFTYALNEQGNLFGLISIFFIYWSGVEVEKFFGRWIVLKLYATLLLIGPLASTLCWLAGYHGENLILFGCSTISFGLLTAFATLYPRAELPAAFTLRTVTLILLGIRLVVLLKERNGVGAIALLATCAVSSIFILRLRHGPELSFSRLFQNLRPEPQPRIRVLPDPPRRKVSTVPLTPKPEEADVDALLDKIAKSGLASLTTSERRKLEAARQELLRKERR